MPLGGVTETTNHRNTICVVLKVIAYHLKVTSNWRLWEVHETFEEEP